MSELIEEFKKGLGVVRIYHDKIEYSYKLGLFGFGKLITQIININDIKSLKIVDLSEVNGTNINPLNYKVVRINPISKSKIVELINNKKVEKINNDYIDISGLKSDSAKEIYDGIYKSFKNIQEERKIEVLNKRLIKKEVEENQKKAEVQLLNDRIKEVLYELDKNQDGEIDLIENDFIKILNKNQNNVIQIDKNYIHQFVKISNFIKSKRENIQSIFSTISDTTDLLELNERVSLLKNQIHSYDLLVFHSINMIGALINGNLIVFYEVYESFDKLKIFNSNWENEVSDKLTSIDNKLDDLLYSIYNMEQNLISELSNLSYVTQESFSDLNYSIIDQLKEVGSSINTNNLLSSIQTYQLYRLAKK